MSQWWGGGECPCGSGQVTDGCCGPLLRGESQARTAQELMRSRYTAYALGDLDHVFRTWHPRTRPAELAPDEATQWTGLRVLDVMAGGPDDTDGVVEFEASFTDAAGKSVLRERSSFVRRGPRWVYVEALGDR